MARALRTPGRLLWMAACLGVALGSGCGHTATVTGEVLQPARVPVRTFPRIWVAAGHRPSERRLADALVTHLRTDGTPSVRRVDVETLEPARQAGRIPPATVVLLLDLSLEERTRSEWMTRPETICGAYGCYTQQRSHLYEVPVVEGGLTLTVYDGPTARILQRVTLDESARGAPHEELRRRVVAALSEKARNMVDQRAERVEVVLLEVDVPAVDRAIDRARKGAWAETRRLLEQAARSERGLTLERTDRARLLYDLGQARRFDPSTLDRPDAHFAAAAEALRRARELDPRPLYDAALADLEEHREQVDLVIQQRAATRRNYERAGAGREDGIPSPPPGYLQ